MKIIEVMNMFDLANLIVNVSIIGVPKSNLLSVNVLPMLLQAQAVEPPPMWMQFIPIGLIILVFYFLVIRPQNRQLDAHKKMISSLQKGDNILTKSGIYGKIVEVEEQLCVIEIADKVKVRMSRESIAGVIRQNTQIASSTTAENK